MSIQVNDFRWEPGENDAEYIRLLESSRDEWQKIAQKAIAKLKALSKAQQPRLLTVDDFKNNSDVDICGYLPCWVEPNPYNDAATEKPGWGLVSVGQIGGVYHRYWTGKPTQEQMEAMKWDG